MNALRAKAAYTNRAVVSASMHAVLSPRHYQIAVTGMEHQALISLIGLFRPTGGNAICDSEEGGRTG
jgi:hypothetical protein